VIEALRISFSRHADRIAVTEPGIEITYGELDDITDRGGAALWRLGLRPQDRVLFQIRNCKELVFALISCLKIGVIPICTLAAHRQQEISYLGNHGGAKAHFVHADDPRFDMVAFARDMKLEIASLEHIVTVRGGAGDGAVSFEELVEAEDATEARALVSSIEQDPYQVVLFQLSGGTSGVPKIIPRFSNEYRYSMQTVIDFHGLDENMVAFTANPMMHNAPMICFWGPALMCGGEVAIAGGPSLTEIEAVLAARKPTWIALAKVHMLRLVEAGAPARISRDQIKGCIVGDSAATLGEAFGAPCFPIFGMTEGLLAFCRQDDPAMAIATSVGHWLSDHDETRIVAPGTEHDLPEGETGELLVRGPCTIRGYYDAADRNEEAFTRDGFYRSGDLIAIRQIEGRQYFFFEGRVKDVVDRGGEKINCSEVEALAGQHPSVGEVACVGMPDPLYGERLCAFIVLREGEAEVSVDQLGGFLAEAGLAKFKFPERIEHVAILPMTSSGKPSKPKMREYVTERLKAGT
jgi:non-ribosomal peptide synthetase component E (peptide arylation enzyme)